MGDKVAWGVFKGLFGFFILLPIAILVGFVVLAMVFAGIEAIPEAIQKKAEEKQTMQQPTVNAAIETKKQRETAQELQKERLRQQQARADQEGAMRIEKKKKAEELF